MSVLTDIVSPELRKKLYIAFGVAILVLGAAEIGFRTAGSTVPTAIDVVMAVVFFLGAPFGFTAASNIFGGGKLEGPLTDEIEAAEAPVEPLED